MTTESGKIDRVQVEGLDAILGIPFKVLDDGFVRVIDYMGSDESIVQAARVSYGKGTKRVHEDRGLIRYLEPAQQIFGPQRTQSGRRLA